MLTTIIILSGFACLNGYIFKHILHPISVFCLLWLIQITGVYFLSSIYAPLSLEVLLIVVFGVLFFSMGGYCALLLPTIRNNSNRELNSNPAFLFLVFLICGGALIAQILIVDGQPGETLASKMIGLRVRESIHNEDVFGLWKYFSTLSMAFMLFLSIQNGKPQKTKMARVLYPLMITLALIMAFLSTGRTPIIITLLILVLVAVTNGKRFTGYLSLVKYASLGIASLFGIFWAMGLMFGKVGSSFNDAVYNLTTYIFSGLPALDSFIHSSGFLSKEPSLGENTFRFARAVFSKIGYMEAPAPLVQEFVQVPHDTNLFTIYHIYLKDFGFVGVCLPLFILGLFHNLVYRQYMRNEDNDFIRYFLVLSYVPLVQVIFQETYLSLVSTWIQFLLVAFLLTKKRFNYG